MASRAQVTRRSLLAAGLAAVVGGAVLGTDALAPGEDESPRPVGPGAGAGAAPEPSGPPTSIVVVGDSITAGSEQPIHDALETAGFTDITVEAQPSRRIDVGGGGSEPRSGTQAVASLLDDGASPDVWVIALGTNDVGKYADEQAYAALIDELLAMLPDRPVVWVDVYRRDYLEHSELFNATLRDRLAARGDATVVSWFELASQRNQKILQADRLHPNELGSKFFANLIATGVADVA